MKHQLTEKDIKELVEKVERGLSGAGSPKVEVSIKHGEVVVYQINSKRIP